MSRGGKTKSRIEPERRCLVTKISVPKSDLIRFVTSPDGTVVPDVLGKLPGRGYYIKAESDLLKKAMEKKMFAGAAKAQVKVPENLVHTIEAQLAKHVVELISLARKAGLSVAGFEKVKSWLADNKVRVLLQASDGSERGKTKLWTPEGARYFDCLNADELGLAFGRGHVIHGALAAGGLSDRVIEDAARLRGLRSTQVGKKDERVK